MLFDDKWDFYLWIQIKSKPTKITKFYCPIFTFWCWDSISKYKPHFCVPFMIYLNFLSLFMWAACWSVTSILQNYAALQKHRVRDSFVKWCLELRFKSCVQKGGKKQIQLHVFMTYVMQYTESMEAHLCQETKSIVFILVKNYLKHIKEPHCMEQYAF